MSWADARPHFRLSAWSTTGDRPSTIVAMRDDQGPLRANKDVVLRFNREVIEQGSAAALEAIVAPDFVNRTAPPGLSAGRDGMWHMVDRVLRPAFPDLRVEIHDQIAEGDKVTTRKTIRGTHRGELLGVPPTNQEVAIEVIDIVRLAGGRYIEHWGMNTLAAVVASLRARADAGG
jgi:predicted ester cyclase